MGVEIRQLVVKSSVVHEPSHVRSNEIERARELQAFRESVLAECRRVIRRSLEERTER